MPNQATGTLYIRGMPEEIARQARAAAALRGMTLSQLVSEALKEYLKVGFEPQRASIRDDCAWFETNRANLMADHAGEYLAIVDGAVVDHDAEFGALARRVFERFPGRAVFMPRCHSDGRPVKLRSPRLARK